MTTAATIKLKEIYNEIDSTPPEYLPALFDIIKGFRNAVAPKKAEKSFRDGMNEALKGETLPIEKLWNDIDG